MRSILAVGFVAALAPSARAEEAACSLRVLEAPAEVRDALVGWASGEKRCHALEIRITPTGGGYALWARGEDGRTFTRQVTDPRTAALLVVSWAGDDTLPAGDPPTAPIAAPIAAPSTTAPIAPIAPGASVPDVPLAATATLGPTEHARPRARQLVLAAIGNPGDGEDVDGRSGVRASLDLAAHGAWRVGVSGMVSDEHVNIYSYATVARVAQASEPRATLMGYLARSFARDRVRLAAGAGVSYAQLSDVVFDPGPGPAMLQRVGISTPAIELSAFAAYPISARWSVTGGVVITATAASGTSRLLVDPDHFFALDHDDGTQVVGALGVARSL